MNTQTFAPTEIKPTAGKQYQIYALHKCHMLASSLNDFNLK